MQSQVRNSQAVQKQWKSNTSGHLPCRYATVGANDVKGTESVNTVKILSDAVHRQDHQDPSDRAEADAEDAQRTKGTPGYPVYRNSEKTQEVERELEGSTRHEGSVRTSLSRVPAGHEAQCQVKDRKDS